MLLRRLASTSFLALVATLVPPALPARAAEVTISPDPVVVRFDADVAAADRAGTLAAVGLTLLDQLPGSDFALAVPDTGTAAAATGDGIAALDPVVRYRAFGVPNDPAYVAQWHLPAIDAASAWDVTTGEGTIVAVIDSGVAYETSGPYVAAPDLAGTRFVPGWDFVSGDDRPNDENGHGTHVTGSIAQTTGNGVGGAGVAPGVAIMPLRVLDATGAGSDFNVAQAIRFAADHGAAVANISLGGLTSSSVVRDAVSYAGNKGMLVVAASGNDGATTVSYPAADPGVVAVGSVRYDRTRAPYSNQGAALDLVAPGGDMLSDQNGDGYPDGILQQTFLEGWTSFCMCFMQGTSMAAPQVSAVAALVAARGVTDPAAIEQVLKASAVDLGPPGWDPEYGAGLVQAGAAVRAPLPGGAAPAEPASAPSAGPASPGASTWPAPPTPPLPPASSTWPTASTPPASRAPRRGVWRAAARRRCSIRRGRSPVASSPPSSPARWSPQASSCPPRRLTRSATMPDPCTSRGSTSSRRSASCRAGPTAPTPPTRW